MDKRFSWIFLLASGAFFVFIVGLTGYRIEDARRRAVAASHESVSALAARVHSLVDTTGSIQSPLFAAAMRDLFNGEPRLLLVSVHSPRDGILYLLTRDRSYLKEPATPTPEWRGTPTYQVNGGGEALISTSVGTDMPDVTLDALYVVMGQEDLYPVVRDDLYFFLAFLLVVGVSILIVMSIEEGSPPARAASPVPAGSSGALSGGSPVPSSARSDQPWRARSVTPPEPSPPAPQASEPLAAAPAEDSRSAGPRAFSSPRTGLVWAEYLEPRLTAELERASSSDGEISMAKIRIDEPFADARLPMAYGEIAQMLKQVFPLHDLLFEEGDEGYTVILPDADVDSAVRLLEDLRTKVSAKPIEDRIRTLSAGVSSRGGRLIDPAVLVEEAQVALAKAEREGGNQVVGFRADSSRFRQQLATFTR